MLILLTNAKFNLPELIPFIHQSLVPFPGKYTPEKDVSRSHSLHLIIPPHYLYLIIFTSLSHHIIFTSLSSPHYLHLILFTTLSSPHYPTTLSLPHYLYLILFTTLSSPHYPTTLSHLILPPHSPNFPIFVKNPKHECTHPRLRRP